MTKKELEKEIKRLQKEVDEVTLENIYLKEQLNEFKLNPSDTRFEDKMWGINSTTL